MNVKYLPSLWLIWPCSGELPCGSLDYLCGSTRPARNHGFFVPVHNAAVNGCMRPPSKRDQMFLAWTVPGATANFHS